MILHCQRVLPWEGCGMLSGNNSGNTLWKMRNESDRLNRFFMSADSIKQIVEYMNEIGEELSAIFHSHPNSPAVPSSSDIINNSYPNLPYIIVSFYKDEVDVRCYNITEDRMVSPIKIVILEQ